MSFSRVAHCAMVLAVVVGPAHLRAQAAPSNDIYLVRMSRSASELTFDRPINITDRDGYDNQPSFHPDNSLVSRSSPASYHGTQALSNWGGEHRQDFMV